MGIRTGSGARPHQLRGDVYVDSIGSSHFQDALISPAVVLVPRRREAPTASRHLLFHVNRHCCMRVCGWAVWPRRGQRPGRGERGRTTERAFSESQLPQDKSQGRPGGARGLQRAGQRRVCVHGGGGGSNLARERLGFSAGRLCQKARVRRLYVQSGDSTVLRSCVVVLDPIGRRSSDTACGP